MANLIVISLRHRRRAEQRLVAATGIVFIGQFCVPEHRALRKNNQADLRHGTLRSRPHGTTSLADKERYALKVNALVLIPSASSRLN
jgi:hypothetical protein